MLFFNDNDNEQHHMNNKTSRLRSNYQNHNNPRSPYHDKKLDERVPMQRK